MIDSIPHLPNNPLFLGQAEVKRHIVYSRNGQELTLILPWSRPEHMPRRNSPLILFVQGSAWTTPNMDFEIPMLSHFAEAGAAVATVSHRSAAEGHPLPAFLVDVKCAIRYLRAHASEYDINAERIVAFGTSSGGHTVCCLGLTGDDPRFRTEEYAKQSDAVQAVVACFAPTDLTALFTYLKDMPNGERTLTAYFGPDSARWPEAMRELSTPNMVRPGVKYPPFMLLHGTADPLVPVSQLDALYTPLKEAGAEVSAVYVDGAEHEGSFWSPEVRGAIYDEIMKRLGL